MSESNGWRTKELQALVEIDPEVLRENTDRRFHFHYVDIASVSEGHIDVPSATIAFRESPSRARKVVRCGDVLMSTVRPNLKAFAPFDYPYEDCVASTGFAVLRAKPDVDSRFVLYSILSESVTRQIEAHVVGSNYPAINSTAVSQLKILTPPPIEQSKIADVLSTVDRAIRYTETQIAKQQRIKTGLMQDLLTRGIDEQGNLRSEETHEFKDCALGRIPVEWEVETLGEVIGPILSGWSPTCDPVPASIGEWAILKTTACVWSGYDESENKRLPAGLREIPKIEVAVDDILITRKGPVDRVGVVVHVHKTRPQLMIPDTVFKMRLTDDSEVIPAFFPLALGSAAVQSDWLQKKIGLADAQVNLNHSILRTTRFPKPKPVEQELIVKVLTKSAQHICAGRERLAKLKSLKTALMQDLLTGEKRVTPLLEPAATT